MSEVPLFDVHDAPPARHAHAPFSSGFKVQGSGSRIQGSGLRDQGTGFRVQGAGCRVQGAGCRVLSAGPRGRAGAGTECSGQIGARVQTSPLGYLAHDQDPPPRTIQ